MLSFELGTHGQTENSKLTIAPDGTEIGGNFKPARDLIFSYAASRGERGLGGFCRKMKNSL
jgi:hypothetical protein